jgi:hypothetical protein
MRNPRPVVLVNTVLLDDDKMSFYKRNLPRLSSQNNTSTWALGSSSSNRLLETRNNNNGVLIRFLCDPHQIQVKVGAKFDRHIMDQAWTTDMLLCRRDRAGIPTWKLRIWNLEMVSSASRIDSEALKMELPFHMTTTTTTPLTLLKTAFCSS